MGTSRNLRKTLKQHPEPMILFIPNETDTYVKFISERPDMITVTDRKIYTRVLEVVTMALEQNRQGVLQSEKKRGD